MSALRPLTACPDCDLLQRLPVMAGRDQALCLRCAAVLSSPQGRSPGHTLALALTAAMLFLIANAYPIVTLESQGIEVSATLFGAVALLWQAGMHFIALLVLVTTILGPGTEIVLLLVVLCQRAPSALALRWLERFRPWSMVDVFVLGLIVSIKKLADIALIVPGPALWAFCVLMFLIAFIRSGGGLSVLWARVAYPGQVHAG